MKQRLTYFLLFVSIVAFAQTESDWKKSAFTLTPEILLGLTMEANDGFPDTKLQQQAVLNFGHYHTNNPQEWAQRLKGPKTGLSLGITDFGHRDSLGIALTGLTFIEFTAFNNERFKIHTGIGASYFSKKFHPDTNPQNRAVTTDVTWAFRMYLYYQFFSTKKINWRVGLGYSHHSNGHTRLMNQGYNSFLASLSAEIKNPFGKNTPIAPKTFPKFKNKIGRAHV